MNILLLGSGGREHAIAHKLLQSRHLTRLWVAPGNSGIAEHTECIDLNLNNPEAVLEFSQKQSIDLVVIGPEAPLVAGVSDALRKAGIKVFGPSAKAAQLEASKAFTKELTRLQNIPTAAFEAFHDARNAKAYLQKQTFPIVIKADGLAAGKGVFICQNLTESLAALDEIFEKKSMGEQSRVVIEAFLTGEEASFIGVYDGKTFLPLASSQDHKRLLDDDQGLNTGGMGAYSPAPILTNTVSEKTVQQIIQPTFLGLKKQQIDYQGVLYAGLMIEQQNPFLLEYNARFGDPECQVILSRLQSDLIELILATLEGSLDHYAIQWDPRVAVCVVLAAEGYPQLPRKGDVIKGLEEAGRLPDVFIYHAGTVKKEGKWLTNGGRVLGVTALGETLPIALQKAYEAVDKINFEGMHYRKDIGKKGI